MSPETIRYFLSLDMKVAFIWIGLIGVKSTGIFNFICFYLAAAGDDGDDGDGGDGANHQHQRAGRVQDREGWQGLPSLL